MSKLYENILSEYGKAPFRALKIPEYISQNLNKNLRTYQQDAIKLYLANNETFKKNHLMFNMATGSGKTLVMAALMLDCYKRGYRNFVFFVNSTSILEKTKSNFCDDKSSKYLFKNDIEIDGKIIQIKSINNFNESSDDAINIYFDTIQGLFSLFKNEKENSLTLDDLKNHKIVFLADEAHHLNADTKKISKNTQDDNDGWEGIMNKAFKSHEDNLMLEFSATLPNDKNVLRKYEDKLIYEYALKEFCQDGYSKKIFLVKYDEKDIKTRFLGACLLSVYREILARQNHIALKPVILFKSETIESSKENQECFNKMLDNLKPEDIINFYNLTSKSKEDELFKYSLEFFQKKFGDYEKKLAEYIQMAFKSIYQLNVNNENQAKDNQIKLNTLEDKKNEIRVIFAVDKLNEGWDVLNLFDIVRLGSKIKNIAKTTTKEAQLIGRGARYFPFLDPASKNLKDKRKYDNVNNELSILEKLSYHGINDVEYIKSLKNELKKQGLLEELESEVVLEPSKRAKKITSKNEIFYVNNKKINLDKSYIFNPYSIQNGLERLEIPLIKKALNTEESYATTNDEPTKNIKILYMIKDVIDFAVILKAMNILNIDFDMLKLANENIKSKRDFYDFVLGPLEILFDKKQEFDDRNIQLELAKNILQNYKELLKEKRINFVISDFSAHKLENTGARKITRSVKGNISTYEWLYYDKYFSDSNLEIEFLDFIEANKDKIDNKFSEWIIMRNEGYEEFKIYDNRKGEATYGLGFEPDFIFFGKLKDEVNKKYLSTELIMESKGEHLIKEDKWKEDLILDKSILNEKIFKCGNAELNVFALPFFLDKNNKNFKDEFFKIFK